MLGTFQQSQLRIEVESPEATIRDSLVRSDRIQQWMLLLPAAAGLPEQLQVGTVFTSRLGAIAIRHQVQSISPNHLCLTMSHSIDGWHQWDWGDGWVQSRLEGVSWLPLNLGQTLSLLRLRQFLNKQHQN